MSVSEEHSITNCRVMACVSALELQRAAQVKTVQSFAESLGGDNSKMFSAQRAPDSISLEISYCLKSGTIGAIFIQTTSGMVVHTFNRRRSKLMSVTVPPNLTYRFNEISDKIPASHFIAMDKGILKVIWKNPKLGVHH